MENKAAQIGAHHGKRKPAGRRHVIHAVLTHLLLGLGGIGMVAPLVWMISTSLKEPAEVMTYPPEIIPRRQVTWESPAGEVLPVFETTIGQETYRVARVASRPGEADVVVIEPPEQYGRTMTVPLTVTRDGRTERALRSVREVHFRWSNYPKAWTAMKLQYNWLAWRLPWQVRIGPYIIGPLEFGGFPIRNAFLAFYLNSVFVTVIVTVGVVFTSSLAAFAFARMRFPGRDKLFLGYLATMMVPAVVTMIPVFVLLKVLRLHDTYLALILPPMFSAYGTFLLRQFFLSIPPDLEDAARIDGCGPWGIYRHVIIPLSRPALATLTTFTFLGTWNSFMWPLIVIDSTEKKPLMLGLYAFMSQHTTEWTLLMAASLMVLAPVLLVFIIGQRYFVEGIALSGMKG